MLSFLYPLAIGTTIVFPSHHLVSSFTVKIAPPQGSHAAATISPSSPEQYIARPDLLYNRSSISARRSYNNRPLLATIIGWDDESDSYISSFDEPTVHGSIFAEQPSTATTVMNNNLSSTPASTVTDTLLLHNMDKIARLAVAYSPSSQPIKLEDINQIHIINVTNQYIDISVVVCDESQCVTLLVPISFHHDCSIGCSDSGSTDQCILDSIFELDVKAQHLIEQQRQQEKEQQQQSYLGYYSDLRP